MRRAVHIAPIGVGKLAMRVVPQTENSLFPLGDVLVVDDEARLAMEVVNDPSHNLDLASGSRALQYGCSKSPRNALRSFPKLSTFYLQI
jgi:hypothetical protein